MSRPWASNPGAGTWTAPAADDAVLDFHRSIPGYAATPLVSVDVPGLGPVWVKDESNRFGLPAFKVLGASWAVNRAAGTTPARTFAELADRVAGHPLTLVTATDGNHGRALAHIAALLGLRSRIYVPAGLPGTTIDAIRNEGAEVIETGQLYDDAVQTAAASCASSDRLIQDTAWPGYEDVPRWIVAGYSTLFAEIDAQLPDEPGVVAVPTGVGSLLQSAIEHYRAPGRSRRTTILAVEPVSAACVTGSLRAGAPVTVDTAAPTILAGLNCGTVSSTAWPAVRQGLDAGIGVTDAEATLALEFLHEQGLRVGPCGAAALAGFQAASTMPDGPRAGDGPVVLISTEGIDANRTVA